VWSLKYCLLIFISVLGVIQLAAARNNLRGLYFLPWKRYTAALGLVGIAFSLFVFFTWDEMNSRIIEGSQQTASFVLSSAAGVLFTVLFSSLLNFRRFKGGAAGKVGLDHLQDSTVFQSLFKSGGYKDR
jgi:hypothetical protein